MIKYRLYSALMLLVVSFLAVMPGRSNAAIITMSDLVNGDTLQMENLLFTDWSVSSSSFDLSKLTMGPDPNNSAILFMTPSERVLQASSGEVRSITFDFKVTGLSGLIAGITGDLRYGYVDGFSSNSPSLRLDTLVGTSQGASDLGSSSDLFSLNTNTDTSLIDFADRSSVWVRTTYTLRGNSGFAEGGYLSGLGFGPALQAAFMQAPAQTVPEPSVFVLLVFGIVGLSIGTVRDRRIAVRLGLS